VSVVSLWEIAVKVQLGKLDFPSDSKFYLHHIDQLHARTLPANANHAFALLRLPTHPLIMAIPLTAF
jgi:PIN domain nuclease of toxin-antitoxin system